MSDQKWEYRIEQYGSIWHGSKPEEIEDFLNALGAEGWEVINLHHAPNSSKVWITIKRPVTTITRRRRNFPGDEENY